MKSKVFQISILFAATSIGIIACRKDNKSVTADKAPRQDVFAVDYNQLPNNEVTSSGMVGAQVDNDQAALGRLLFYDTRLSLTGTIACASCHKQDIGFADNLAFSTGFTGKSTTLNALPISNLSSDNILFWRNRAQSLEKLSLMPVSNHIEMGFLSLNDVVRNISSVPMYKEYFEKVFNTVPSEQNISTALGQFLRSMQSADSKYDQGYTQNGQNADFDNFTNQENYGKKLFFQTYNCASCHGVPSKIMRGWSESMSNIGLDDDSKGEDAKGAFKVPSLRNIALTAPYMHDGRFKTLDDVLDHYSHNIKMNESLSWQLRDFDPNTNESKPKQFNIPEIDRAALIAFLKTLTDVSYTHDKRFSNPFLP